MSEPTKTNKRDGKGETNGGAEFLTRHRPAKSLGHGLHIIAGQGNSIVVETERGIVVTDSGPGGSVSRRMIDDVRAISNSPVIVIVYSHGHIGYNHGIPLWLEAAASRGDPAPELVAHERLSMRYKRYQETWGLQSHLAGIQFGVDWPEKPPAKWFTLPTETLSDSYEIDGKDRKVIVFAAPSETDDAVALWIPDCRTLYAGPAFINSIPNVGTPLRTLRDPMRWVETLRRFLELEPEVLIAEFGEPIIGRDAAREALEITIDGLVYLRRETVRRMNKGMTEAEILHDMEYPESIFGHPLMKPIYGTPEYIVRDIWRSENGWWDRNPTSLHPARPQTVAQAIRESISDPSKVLAVARQRRQAGEPHVALHILDLLALAPSQDHFSQMAREEKASIMAELADSNSSFISRQIYSGEAQRLREKNDEPR